jgi:hypothetical protein
MPEEQIQNTILKYKPAFVVFSVVQAVMEFERFG